MRAIFNWLIMLLPMVLIFGFFIFIMRQAGGGGQNRAMQFGRSRARKLDNADRPTVTFADVAGADEAKQELQEVVEFLKEPQKFAALGARIPKGVLHGWRARHRQNAAGQSRCRRSGRALLQQFRLRICGDVRGRGRQPCARPV